ncbi:MAG: copper amine oxidase N-terminal domain-containing protein [Clostridia bacterium]|nr:copper amine oxidase N-terminal domain-containing protein [Clostridia bacterium]
MFKKISFALAVIMTVTTLGVSAARNPYNEMDCINLTNRTIGDYAYEGDIFVEEFKDMYGLPEDMPADTNETIAMGYIPLKKFAEINGVALEEMIAFYKDGYVGTEEITGDTLLKEVEGNVALLKALGENPIEEFKAAFGFGDEITGDTPYRVVENVINRKMLKEAKVLSYDDGTSILVMVKGKYVDFDVAPVIENDRVLVPMRNIFEALGATVSWQGDVNTVLATKGQTVVALQPGQEHLFKNSVKVPMPVPSIAKYNRILVPIRAVAEAFDTEVFYNANTKTVVIH